MSISVHRIKKWFLMLTGKSLLHVNQDIGKCFSVKNIEGYYNNLTEKVTKEPELLETERLPVVKTDDGREVVFPVAIFQYGLGAYDLYLKTKDDKYLYKFRQCVEWASENMLDNGAWDNFSHIYPDNPYGAMAQGEGVSLLARGYKEFGNQLYFQQCRKAVDFMLKSVNDGGTTLYDDGDVVLLEYTHKAPVLNGWIFALWGLYDWVIMSGESNALQLYNASLESLVKFLPRFSCGYWSMYDLDGKITSPFYHRLHIAQLQAMYAITKLEIFDEYEKIWDGYLNHPIKKIRAFVKKAWQKVVE